MKRLDTVLNTALYCGLPLAGILLGTLLMTAVTAPVGLACFVYGLFAAGLALLVVAKASMFRRGVFVSFGSSRMSVWNRRAYRAGYGLLLLGVLAAIVLIWVMSRWGGPPP